mmetsp:Transcript_122499/g.280777  ORF Transcript_122499/g.280777 Transcript_122499/m.280777 type:complete len:217 (+) Transcript_122499:927-1577(+)
MQTLALWSDNLLNHIVNVWVLPALGKAGRNLSAKAIQLSPGDAPPVRWDNHHRIRFQSVRFLALQIVCQNDHARRTGEFALYCVLAAQKRGANHNSLLAKSHTWSFVSGITLLDHDIPEPQAFGLELNLVWHHIQLREIRKFAKYLALAIRSRPADHFTTLTIGHVSIGALEITLFDHDVSDPIPTRQLELHLARQAIQFGTLPKTAANLIRAVPV